MFANKIRSYIIYLDGKKIGHINDGKTEVIPIQPGTHELYLKIDWAYSPKIKFTIAENQTKYFECATSATAWKAAIPLYAFYAITFGRKKYLTLKEVG
jgi:hypothetical protein